MSYMKYVKVWLLVLWRTKQAVLALSIVMLLGSSLTSQAEYRLSPGDTLEFTAAGVPELKQRSTISIEGEIYLPILGKINVGGTTMSDLRVRVEEALSAKVFRRRTDDGREVPVAISADEVVLTIVEYRPIYLDGDVSRPGEQVYRPGMTVRQAVSLAGGYDLRRVKMENPFLELSSIRAEYDGLWGEFAKEQAAVWRLEAELEGKKSLDPSTFPEVALPRSVATRIRNLEMDSFNTRAEDVEKEKRYLAVAIEKENGRIQTLNDQKQREQEGADADQAEVERIRELYQRGAVPVTRVTEARRSLLLASTRYLDTVVQLGQVERGKEDFARRLQKVDDQRRLEILRDLQTANAQLVSVRTRLQAASEKLLYVGTLRSALVRGTSSKADLAVFREVDGRRERMVADENTDLLPGDVVEVSLLTEVGLPRMPTTADSPAPGKETVLPAPVPPAAEENVKSKTLPKSGDKPVSEGGPGASRDDGNRREQRRSPAGADRLAR